MLMIMSPSFVASFDAVTMPEARKSGKVFSAPLKSRPEIVAFLPQHRARPLPRPLRSVTLPQQGATQTGVPVDLNKDQS